MSAGTRGGLEDRCRRRVGAETSAQDDRVPYGPVDREIGARESLGRAGASTVAIGEPLQAQRGRPLGANGGDVPRGAIPDGGTTRGQRLRRVVGVDAER